MCCNIVCTYHFYVRYYTFITLCYKCKKHYFHHRHCQFVFYFFLFFFIIIIIFYFVRIYFFHLPFFASCVSTCKQHTECIFTGRYQRLKVLVLYFYFSKMSTLCIRIHNTGWQNCYSFFLYVLI